MRRACKIKMVSTAKKRKLIRSLLESYRAAVNFYAKSLWRIPGSLDKATLARLTRTRLSERYKSAALKQALSMVISTKKAAKSLRRRAGCPTLKGAAILDAKFVIVEKGRGSFDYVIRLSTLQKGKRIAILFKSTAPLNKWLSKPLAKIVQGCALTETGAVLWVELPDCPDKTKGENLGVDIGMNELISTSDGEHYGTGFLAIRDKIRSRQPGSKSRKRAFAERDNFINRTLNQLPWDSLKVLGVEDLKNLKHGKQKRRGKSFRKAVAPWTYRRVLERIGHKAQENRVRLVAVPPAHTSQTCLTCRAVDRLSRKGEKFECTACGYAGDADFVGAFNVLDRTLRKAGSLESPVLQKSIK